MNNLELNVDHLSELLQVWGIRLLTAILTLVIGLIIVRTIVGAFGRTLTKRNVDASLAPFLKSIVRALLIVALVITVASMVGIEMTSFVAVLGAAGLAVG
ncbi:MAG: mechanosensitive ion channel family protein, partial [Catalinimonas sp.]